MGKRVLGLVLVLMLSISFVLGSSSGDDIFYSADININLLNEYSTGDVIDDEVVIVNDSGEEIFSKYSIEYLKKITKASKLSDQVCLEFGPDYPLRAEYKLLDKLRLSFILAPRVSSD